MAKLKFNQILLDEKYINWECLKPQITINDELDRGVIILDSPMGSNKTGILKDIVELARIQGLGILSISSRVTVAKSIADRLGLTFHNDIEQTQLNIKHHIGNYSIVVNSLATMLAMTNLASSYNFKNHIIILDESVQLIFNLPSPLIKNNHAVGEIMDNLISNCHTVVLSDANFNTSILSIYKNSRYFRYNRYNADAIDDYSLIKAGQHIDFPNNIVDDLYYKNTDDAIHYIKNITTAHNKKFIELSFDKLYSSITADVLAGERIYIATDSKEECEILYGHILKLQKENSAIIGELRILAITADNSKSKKVAELLKDTDKFNEYDIIITSPAITTGVSIIKRKISKKARKHNEEVNSNCIINGGMLLAIPSQLDVSRVYGIFRGESVCHLDLLQSLCRVRHVTEIKYGFMVITEKTDPMRKYFLEDEIKNGLNSDDRIKNILRTTASVKCKISNKRPHFTQDYSISNSEKSKFYNINTIISNIDVSAHGLPVNLTTFNSSYLMIATLSKYLSRPAFYFRNLIISLGHGYNIDHDLMKGCVAVTENIDHTQFESVAISTNAIELWDMYNQSQIDFLNTNIIPIDSSTLPIVDNSTKQRKVIHNEYREYVDTLISLEDDQNIKDGLDINYKNPIEAGKYRASINKALRLNIDPDLENAIINSILGDRNVRASNLKLKRFIVQLASHTNGELKHFEKKKDLELVDLQIKSRLYFNAIEMLKNSSGIYNTKLSHFAFRKISTITNYLTNNMTDLKLIFPNEVFNPGEDNRGLMKEILKFGLISYKTIRTNTIIENSTNSHQKLISSWSQTHIENALQILISFHIRDGCNHIFKFSANGT